MANLVPLGSCRTVVEQLRQHAKHCQDKPCEGKNLGIFDGAFAVKSVVRDFVYVRDLDALVVFDRVQSNSASSPKTFLLHFPNSPTICDTTSFGGRGTRPSTL